MSFQKSVVLTPVDPSFQSVTLKLYYRTRVLKVNEYISLLNTYSDHRAMNQDDSINLENEISNVISSFVGEIDIDDTMDLYLGIKP